MRLSLVLLPLAALALTALALAGCAPNVVNRAYAGSPGSTYDAAGNPARANGAVSYDPASPLTPHDFGHGGEGTAAAPAR
jgi:hypothetical protein